MDERFITDAYPLNLFRIGQETLLEENLDTDEAEIVLAPIAVQLAFVQQVFPK